VCGLCLESDIPFSLPEPARRATPDIRFSLKPLGHSSGTIYPNRTRVGEIKNGAGHPSIAVYRLGSDYLLDCHNTQRRVEFVMPRDGRWIDCYAHAVTTVEDIELWLFGLITSFILQSRGIFSLHAAAINYRGQGIAFLGANGFGKSTLAYFFAKNGHSLITDDVLPLVNSHGRLFAAPGCPSMNLWMQTLDQLGTRDSNVRSNGGKQRYSVDALEIEFWKSPVPLQRLYVLHPMKGRGKPELINLSKSRAMIELFAFTRSSSTIDLACQDALLKTYSSLLSQVPVRTLLYPRGFEHLPDIYQTILHDCAR
jgi:hypothetical protein